MQREIALEQTCLKIAKDRGGLLVKQTSLSGFPDRLLITHKGTMCLIEFKDKKGVLSRIQEVQIERLKKMGALVFICRSKDEFLKIYEEVQHETKT